MMQVEIEVGEKIDARWSDWFGHLQIKELKSGTAILSGNVADQAEIYGVLSRLWSLGLPLVSVQVGKKLSSQPTIYVNARAIIERQTDKGLDIILQTRHKPHEGRKSLELPGGRVETFEPLIQSLRREVFEETGLHVTEIVGLTKRVEDRDEISIVECLAPYSVYQTIHGPVDSFGVYFRCHAEGEPAESGDDSENVCWVPVQEVNRMLQDEPDRFSWVDRAGLRFYLGSLTQLDENHKSE